MLPELWVVVTYSSNGVMHTWGPYTDVYAAGRYKTHLMRLLSYDQGVTLRVCRIHNPRPILDIVTRTIEVTTYDVPDSTTDGRPDDSDC